MDQDALRKELEEVDAEIVTVDTASASLRAKKAGLVARRAELARALGTSNGASGGKTGLTVKYRTDAIVEVLKADGGEMTIINVLDALHAVGRPHEAYDNVANDLAYLVTQGRARRVRRGVYGTS